MVTTTGTSGNDTFSGILDTAAAPNDGTYQIGDVIDGGAGTDTLNLTLITGNPAGAARADVKNVEVINIRNISGGAAEFGAAQISGATQIWSSESNQDLTVSSVANLVAVGLNKTAKNITVKFADTVVAGAADALTVALNEAGTKAAASTVTVTNQTGAANVIEALTVSTTGSKTNYVDVNGVGNAVKTLTATGAAALEVTVNPTALVTVDASAATGGVKVTGTLIGTAAAGLTVTGSAAADQFTIDLTNKAVVNAGAGNDVVTLTAVASLTSTDSINGGDGTDVLALAVADAKTVAANTARTVITGFETLRVTGDFADVAADNFDISKFGINSLQVDGNSGNAANTVSNFTSGATVEFRLAADQVNALNIGMKNATDAGTDSDTLNIKLNADLVTQANANAAVEASNAFEVKVGVDGINILNVTTADRDNTDGATKATDGYILTLSSAANVTAINVSGDKELSFTSAATTNALKTLDATTLTGNLNVDLSGFGGTQGVEVKGGAGVNTITGTSLADIITGGAKDDVLVGGAGNDKISGGDGKDTITGGTGADVLTGGAGVDTFVIAAGDSLVATADSITDLAFGVGGDVIKFNGGATPAVAGNIVALSAAGQANVTAAATLALAATQVAIETSGVKIVTVFTYGTDSYLMYNNADDNTFDNATDALVKITGVTGTIDASNIFVA
ncbi:Hemolysin-type calcium-binding repeat-containing protein [Polaromonas sp. OV174]|uniref:beta strand repeat-containing protein n=1 Tax=Polaromonas sp. OV174 TaxID=1855300 RepID=UPI0008F02758|nr:calcium-binding protein [Polaromonas sp. OV174]SFC17655.1 Hemolysin-type calcium-binding repeat-containing protein [Polaromonas sp. OV174]